MPAPCGIEINTGQVWKCPENMAYEIAVVQSTEYPIVHMVGRGICECSAHVDQFTNKRGGYKLVPLERNIDVLDNET